MNIVKHLILYLLIGATCAGMYYLYQRQLGAISFLILSIVFFMIGFKMMTNRYKDKE